MKMVDEIQKIAETLKTGFGSVHKDIQDGIYDATRVINAGRAGIKKATEMINETIKKFLDIANEIDMWVKAITSTR